MVSYLKHFRFKRVLRSHLDVKDYIKESRINAFILL